MELRGLVPNLVPLQRETPSTAFQRGYEVWSGRNSVAPAGNRKPDVKTKYKLIDKDGRDLKPL